MRASNRQTPSLEPETLSRLSNLTGWPQVNHCKTFKLVANYLLQKAPELPRLSYANCVRPLLVEVKPSQFHGLGVFSRQEVPWNETILAEHPAFTVKEFTESSIVTALN